MGMLNEARMNDKRKLVPGGKKREDACRVVQEVAEGKCLASSGPFELSWEVKT